MKLFTTFARDENGGVIAEAGLLLPLFISAGLGTLDLSNLMLQNHKLESQLSMASSYLSRSSDPTNWETVAKQLAVTGTKDGSGNVKIKGWSTGDITITYQAVANSNGEYRGDEDIRIVTVSSNVDYKGFGLLSSVIPNGIQLNASVEERLIGGGL